MSAPLLCVLFLWLAAVLAVGPSGNFPLSDDWAYAHAARSICQDGPLDLLPWTGASLLFQAGYGALLCQLFGPSYEIFRASTLLLGAAGMALVFAAARRAGASAAAAALAAAVVGSCPVYLNLSFTFMTDVPFAVFALLAAWAYIRGLEHQATTQLLLGAAAASASLLIRQHGIFVAAAASAAALLIPAQPMSQRLRLAICAGMLPAVTLGAYVGWIATGHGPLAVQNKISEATGVSLLEIGDAKFRALVTLGFFLLPWTVMLRPRDRLERIIVATSVVVLGLLALFLYLRDGSLMFYLTNVAYDLGVGSVTLRDAFFLALDRLPRVGPLLGVPLTLVSIVSAALLLGRLAATVRHVREPVPAFLLFAFALTFAGSLLQSAYYFDRYLVPIVPLALLATLAAGSVARVSATAVACTAAMAAFSVAGTHDWMEWNRARWKLLTALEQRGVPPTQIDGGMEYNAERLAARLRTAPSDAQARPGQPSSVKSWWWVVDDRYVVAFGPLDGYRQIDARSYRRWLPPGRGHVLLLERESVTGHRHP
ncbi:MAG TPA: glycosyltransferase family 39 protein [Candidatus Limnocylindrales bacterium]|nr:glycosyltransferase family 39 protein [Candidatus Limnocylindrales bacterium]